MPSRPYPLIQTVPVPKGTDAFEAKREEILTTFINKVPQEYYIAQHYVDNPPQDVTSIPRECGVLSEEELEITETYDVVGLAAAIAKRKYSALAVAKAFCKRAIICDQISCCLTQWFPELAYKQAEALDRHLEETGMTVGPFHGVPISIKQHIPIAGTFSDVGFVSTSTFDDKDCQMVSILRGLGAVFYVKTSQPQAIMHLESDNHLGRVLNPFNIDLSAGGSSGGESALIALRGSILGVGTDIGGSIRGPAGFCGIYGYKPTAHILPMQGFIKGGFGAELSITCSTGPMCLTLRDLDLFMNLVLESKPSLDDPRLCPILWTGLRTNLGADAGRPLRIGVMFCDGVIEPQPPVKRAIQWATRLLGVSPLVRLKPYKAYKVADAISMIRQLYWPDGGRAIKSALALTGEPMHLLTEHIMRDAVGKEKTASELLQAHVERDAFRCEFAQDWNEQDVDVVLCPVSVGPAAAHDTSFFWHYTALWNCVDYPSIVFPTPIKAGKKGIEQYSFEQPLSNQDAHVRQMWKEINYEGAPIALQLVARRHHDNQLLGALKLVADILGIPV